MQRASIIISNTESGSLQESAPVLAKPVLVTRYVTEQPDAVATCVVRLVGTDPQAIWREAELPRDDPRAFEERARLALPCGDGMAA